jgi:hypothetical protein
MAEPSQHVLGLPRYAHRAAAGDIDTACGIIGGVRLPPPDDGRIVLALVDGGFTI